MARILRKTKVFAADFTC